MTYIVHSIKKKSCSEPAGQGELDDRLVAKGTLAAGAGNICHSRADPIAAAAVVRGTGQSLLQKCWRPHFLLC